MLTKVKTITVATRGSGSILSSVMGGNRLAIRRKGILGRRLGRGLGRAMGGGIGIGMGIAAPRRLDRLLSGVAPRRLRTLGTRVGRGRSAMSSRTRRISTSSATRRMRIIRR